MLSISPPQKSILVNPEQVPEQVKDPINKEKNSPASGEPAFSNKILNDQNILNRKAAPVSRKMNEEDFVIGVDLSKEPISKDFLLKADFTDNELQYMMVHELKPTEEQKKEINIILDHAYERMKEDVENTLIKKINSASRFKLGMEHTLSGNDCHVPVVEVKLENSERDTIDTILMYRNPNNGQWCPSSGIIKMESNKLKPLVTVPPSKLDQIEKALKGLLNDIIQELKTRESFLFPELFGKHFFAPTMNFRKEVLGYHYELAMKLRQDVMKAAKLPESTLLRGYPKVNTRHAMKLAVDEKVIDSLLERCVHLHNRARLPSVKVYKNCTTADIEDLKKAGIFLDEKKMLEVLGPRDKLILYCSTIYPDLSNITFLQDSNGYALSYQDKDIDNVHPITSEKQIGLVSIKYTDHQKPIIQQPVTDYCTVATSAMLIAEHVEHQDFSRLFSKDSDYGINYNSDDNEIMCSDIKEAKLTPSEKQCSNLADLASAIEGSGSAIVSVNSGSKEHKRPIIVDNIGKDSVRIRDPYHGWEVDIKMEAFLNSWDKNIPIIQIPPQPPSTQTLAWILDMARIYPTRFYAALTSLWS